MGCGRRLVGLITAIALISIGSALMSPRTGSAAAGGVVLTGTVKSYSGERMEGVTVSAKGEGKPITTTVFTDERGNYYFPPLPNGTYRVYAQAQGYAAGRGQVELAGSNQRHEFVLKTMEDVAAQLDGDGWIAALPEDTPNHRKMKDVFVDNCTGCHIASFPLQNRFDEKGWAAILEPDGQGHGAARFIWRSGYAAMGVHRVL